MLPSIFLLLDLFDPAPGNFEQKLFIQPSTVGLQISLYTLVIGVSSDCYGIRVAGRHIAMLEIVGTLTDVVVVGKLTTRYP